MGIFIDLHRNFMDVHANHQREMVSIEKVIKSKKETMTHQGVLSESCHFFMTWQTLPSEHHFKGYQGVPSGKLPHNYGKITMFNGKIHYKWPFSIAILT